jgi:phosphohistidine phosphatase
MKALIIRHAAALARGTPGVLDDERPLTTSGKLRFRTAARGLARIAPRPDVLLTSPLPRAHETAEIAARAFKHVEPWVESSLGDQSVDAIVAALQTHPVGATVALVGHEPLLGALLARLLGATPTGQLTLGKGGAALVDLPDGPSTAGRLVWFLAPSVLRTLASVSKAGRLRRPATTAGAAHVPGATLPPP